MIPFTRLTPLAAALGLACALPAAQAAPDPDLTRELQQMRAQLQKMQGAYEQRIAALEGRLAQAENQAGKAEKVAADATLQASQAQQAAAQVQQAGLRPPGQASSFNPEVSLILQGQVKRMKAIDERGITGFWSPGGHDHDHDGGHGADKRGFSLDHTELVFSANIDPRFRGVARLALIDGEVEVEEASVQTLGLDHGLVLKGGRFLSEIGYSNVQHPHEWDFADASLMQKVLWGDHGYRHDGLQLRWVAPTELFFQLGAETGRGDAFPGTDRNKNGSGSGALFANLGGDLGSSHSWRTGLSYLSTRAEKRESHFEDAAGLGEVLGQFTGRSRTWIADFVWKWAPEGNPQSRNFKFQSEVFRRSEDGTLGCADGDGATCASGDASAYRARQSGGYAQGVYQFMPQWRVGYRYDWLSSGRVGVDASAFANFDPGNSAFTSYRPKKHSLMVDWSASEFSRLRLQFAQDKSMQDVTDNQVILQYIMSLGTHGAHKF